MLAQSLLELTIVVCQTSGVMDLSCTCFYMSHYSTALLKWQTSFCRKYQILAAVFPEGESVVKSDSLEVNLYIPPGEDMKGGPFAYVIATYPGEQGLPELIVAGEDKSSFTNQEVFNGPLRTDVAYNFFISASTQGEEGVKMFLICDVIDVHIHIQL